MWLSILDTLFKALLPTIIGWLLNTLASTSGTDPEIHPEGSFMAYAATDEGWNGILVLIVVLLVTYILFTSKIPFMLRIKAAVLGWIADRLTAVSTRLRQEVGQ